MIAILTLLGLVLFGGGLYGVYDGWPYLVLERGFTEVIIGAISATAGLILLSLAWVLKELKGLRRDLAEARAAAAPVLLEPVPPAAPFDAPAVEVTAPSPSISSPLVPVALGVGAAAVAAVVVDKAEAAAPKAETPERDLFGGLVASHLASAPEEDEHQPEEPSEPEPLEALPDMFETEAEEEPARSEAEPPVALTAESHEPAEIVAAHVQPVSQDEALAHSDDEAEAAAELAGLDEPLRHENDEAADADVVPAAAETAGRDEFAVLRESLTSQLGGLNRPSERIEPSFAREDPFAAAEAWMKPAARREPHFGLALPAEEDADEPALAWPPQTEAHHFDATASRATDEAEAFDAAEEADAEEGSEEPASSHHIEADIPETPEVETPEPDDSPDAASEPSAPEPAASEEGIVGAYQVGEAHFTIYADGSIRARTPDGEYSFASMDELKVYLASEKSRLGV